MQERRGLGRGNVLCTAAAAAAANLCMEQGDSMQGHPLPASPKPALNCMLIQLCHHYRLRSYEADPELWSKLLISVLCCGTHRACMLQVTPRLGPR